MGADPSSRSLLYRGPHRCEPASADAEERTVGMGFRAAERYRPELPRPVLDAGGGTGRLRDASR